MPNSKASSHARGLGWEHQKRRAAILALTPDGAPCPYCGQPMWRGTPLDLDHSVPRAAGGVAGDRMAHASCNRRAGQAISAARKRGTPPPPPPRTSRSW